MANADPPPILGVFVGGKSRRMGGRAKGLLNGPDGPPLLLRLVAIGGTLGLETWLVGDASPYAQLGLPHRVIVDRAADIGPIAGLASLLEAATGRRVIALSCDLPFVTTEDVRELLEHPSSAPVLAARRSGTAPFEPFFARYDAASVIDLVDARIAVGDHSLQRLLANAAAEAYEPTHPRALDDWDTPEDVARAFDRPVGNE